MRARIREAIRLCVALCVAVAPLGARAEIVFKGDFETGDTSQFKGGPNQVHVSVVGSPTREGSHAGLSTLTSADTWPNGLRRVEVGYAPPIATFAGSERYYALSVRTTADLPLVTTITNTIAYFESQTSYHQVMALNVANGKVAFGVSLPKPGQTQSAGTLWTGNFQSLAWHDFVLHVKWSDDATVGFVELWYDGARVLPKTAVQTQYKDATTTYANFFHAGLLHGNFDASTQSLLLDRILETTSYAEAAPPVVTPVDAGIPETDSGTPEPEPDSGTVGEDSGTPDSGADAGPPAVGNEPRDGGTGSRLDVAGSSCSVGGSGLASLALLALLGLALSRAFARRTPSRR